MEAYTISLGTLGTERAQVNQKKAGQYAPPISISDIKMQGQLKKLVCTQEHSSSLQSVSANFPDFLENIPELWQKVQREFTSFEEKSMENHRKVIKKSFYKNLNLIQEQEKQDNRLCRNRKNAFNWQQVEQALNQNEELDENARLFLISKCKVNFEAFFIVRSILQFVPHDCEARCLRLLFRIFQYFDEQKGDELEQDLIIDFIDTRYSSFGVELCQQFVEGLNQWQSKQEVQTQSVKKMVFEWTKTIFLALNGIFQYQQGCRDRKCSFQENMGSINKIQNQI